MYTHESPTHIPMRKARATLRKLVTGKQPVLLLNFNLPAAILVPLGTNRYPTPSERGHLRRLMRTQFEILLMEALPKGD